MLLEKNHIDLISVFVIQRNQNSGWSGKLSRKISRNEYNSLVKEAEREGHLEHYPAEEWNTNRPYEEREQLAEARFDREVQERIQEDREREERYHGDSRFG